MWYGVGWENMCELKCGQSKFSRIELTKVDLTKHNFVLKAGTELSRVIIGNFNPLIPTGQENRYAKNPNNVSIGEFQNAFCQGTSVKSSTGNICLSLQLSTAYKEVFKKCDNIESMVAYKITFLKDIIGIDAISLCLSEGAEPTPKEDDSFWHSFYGPPIYAQALRCRSIQDSAGENIIIFPDNIPDYLSSVSSKPYSKEEIGSAIKQLNITTGPAEL